MDGQPRQASACLARLLHNSLTPYAYNQLRNRSDQYHLNVSEIELPNVDPRNLIPENVEVGALMLHELFKLIAVNASSTIVRLNAQLQKLPNIMSAQGANIQKFNDEIQGILHDLRANNASVPDITNDLLEA